MTPPAGPRRPLPPGGLERAITAGRRKRHQRRVAAAASLSALSVVGAGVLLSLPAEGPPDRLTPAGDPSPDATSSPSPGVALPTGLPTPPPPTASAPGGLPTPPLGSRTPTPSASPPGRRFVGHGPRAADGGPVMTRTTSRDLSFCEAHGQVGQYRAPSGFCTHVDGPGELSAGTAGTYRLTTCRQPEAGSTTLTFPSRAEARFAVDGRWNWNERFAFPPDRRTLTFAPGDCATWAVQWSGQDAEGYTLPPGEYEVVAIALPDEWIEDPKAGPPASIVVEVG